jgi:hypothetical protein
LAFPFRYLGPRSPGAANRNCIMKVTVEVDCTPEEGRRFLGLPDVVPMQQACVGPFVREVIVAPFSVRSHVIAQAVHKFG